MMAGSGAEPDNGDAWASVLTICGHGQLNTSPPFSLAICVFPQAFMRTVQQKPDNGDA